MNTLTLNEKELLLMKDIEKWNNMSLDEIELKKIEKKKIIEKENTSRDSLKSAEEELTRCFCNSFEREGIRNATINLSLKSTRDDILAHIPESNNEYQYLDNNYEKILNKVKKIYENDAKAKEQMQQIIIERQVAEQEKKEKKWNTFYAIFNILGKICKWAFLITFGAIILLFKFIAECAKGK